MSLLNLIDCIEAKNTLKEAQQMFEGNDFNGAADKAAIAFSQLIENYMMGKANSYGRSPFFFVNSWSNLPDSYSMKIPKGDNLKDFVDSVGPLMKEMHESIKILSLGIDYRRYARFRMLTPTVQMRHGIKTEYYLQETTETVLNQKDVQFCMDFVIESALALQESDFEVTLKKRRSLKDAF